MELTETASWRWARLSVQCEFLFQARWIFRAFVVLQLKVAQKLLVFVIVRLNVAIYHVRLPPEVHLRQLRLRAPVLGLLVQQGH